MLVRMRSVYGVFQRINALLMQGDRILIPCNDVDRRLESDLITGS
jgi:hypothetical protein